MDLFCSACVAHCVVIKRGRCLCLNGCFRNGRFYKIKFTIFWGVLLIFVTFFLL